MPTALRAPGFRVYLYSHEPNEPQAHVDPRRQLGQVWLENAASASNAGFSVKELGEVLRLVRARRAKLVEPWHEFFGTGGNA
jgi:Domain of unknown function (DUF4160)